MTILEQLIEMIEDSDTKLFFRNDLNGIEACALRMKKKNINCFGDVGSICDRLCHYPVCFSGICIGCIGLLRGLWRSTLWRLGCDGRRRIHRLVGDFYAQKQHRPLDQRHRIQSPSDSQGFE